jgi:hypothetical protein
MKLVLVLSIILDAFCSHGQSTYQKLFSLQGTWSMDSRRGIIYESWQKINDSSLKIVSYKLMGNDTLLLETVSVAQKGNAIFYIPVVEGQNNGEAVVFTLTSSKNGQYIFENAEHDFPQRVIYELPVNNNFHAWIDGNDKGVYRKTDFYYKKLIQ